jgi:hypothetical protein
MAEEGHRVCMGRNFGVHRAQHGVDGRPVVGGIHSERHAIFVQQRLTEDFLARF